MTNQAPQRQGFTPMAPHLFTPASIQAPVSRPVMDPRVSTQVRAIDRAEQIIKGTWMNLAFADEMLTGVPAMRARGDAAVAEFHRREAKAAYERAQVPPLPPSLHYDTHDTDYDPDAMHEQGVVKIWRVGDDYVHVVRDRWHDSPNRRGSTVGYAAGMLSHNIDTSDYEYDDHVCNANITENCGGRTRLLPVNRGTLILLFRCCWPCEAALCAALPTHRPGTLRGA